jgi:hypothetical protein
MRRPKTLAAKPDCFVEIHVNAGLGKFGGSVEQVFSLFPAGYEFFAAPPGSGFVPWNEGRDLAGDRFFLVAIAGREAKERRDTVSTVGGKSG